MQLRVDETSFERVKDRPVSFDCDLAIVGGGPAGSSTALFVTRREGIEPGRVVLLEKATHPREKPCAGAVSAWGVDALARVNLAIAVPHVDMRGLRIVDRGRVGAHVMSGLGVIVRRDAFDASLWRAATAEGVRAYDGEGVKDLGRVPGGWSIETTASRRIKARFVAACDGAGSVVRKALRMSEPARKGHLYVLETDPGAADVGPRQGLCDFDLGPVASNIDGYYWDFPTVIDGAPAVSRGIYHANLRPSRALKDVLASELGRRGIDIAAVRLKPFSTRPFVEQTVLTAERVVFVGEAAGIDATTGEGIAQAILFGEIAAHHLARALRLGAHVLSGYADAVRASRMGRHLLQSAWLARVVYGRRRGAPFRALLLDDGGARAAGARWYHGGSLSWFEKLRLSLALAARVPSGLAASSHGPLGPTR